MALLLTSQPLLCFKRSKPINLFSLRSVNPSLSFSDHSTNSKFSSFRIYSSYSRDDSEPDSFSARIPINKPQQNEDSDEKSAAKSSEDSVDDDGSAVAITDEWGEKAEPEPEPEASYTKFSDADPPKDNEDEWKEEEAKDYMYGNGSPTSDAVYDKLDDLKKALVDTVYGTELGFRASAEVRAEVLELVNQLEVSNPTLAPVTAPSMLDGNWVLLYTAFSELLPLLAAGATPLLKVKRICQKIDMQNLTIDNSVTFSSPFATFSFSAGATFEVRSPSRIQVQFKEGTFQPPEIKPNVDLPGDVEVFGQKINLAPLQQSLTPVQEAVASISSAISGQPPLKVPIPGERSSSWLLITYLDDDLRISRGDGGLFVLAKEGSSLLYQ
ncbi:plastid lipid-associated protein 3, chloroplastic [Telopea speciosissima]|uniref:plastid lipid-associated protein 3, chloroplastic n=1 Tax=Telopea speciosissima TaxID=54955 RepID=UPI001CC72C79|nr:plastid lipid-associated protein 3, chloroplastic [Telopea speciosissima]